MCSEFVVRFRMGLDWKLIGKGDNGFRELTPIKKDDIISKSETQEELLNG